jgi:hypothetical protein
MTLEIALEMPMQTQSNEVVFFVELAAVKGCSAVEALNTLQAMGYKPDLRLYRWRTQEKERVEVCALLHREISEDPDTVFSGLEPKWKELSDVFGSESVMLSMGADEEAIAA